MGIQTITLQELINFKKKLIEHKELNMIFLYLMSSFVIFVKSFNIDTEESLTIAGEKGTYFGYSALMLQNDNGSWVLVGAPKANISSRRDITTPGNVFKCQLNLTSSDPNDCLPMDLTTDGENMDTDYGQDLQLLGSSMAIVDDVILVCAPLWEDMEEMKVKNKSTPIGRCYIIDKSLTKYTKKPFSTKILKELVGEPDDTYYMAETGFSISPKMIKDSEGQNVLPLGAPGFYKDRGGIVHYIAKEKTDEFFRTYTYKQFYDSDIKDAIEEGSLLGYSISSGTFSFFLEDCDVDCADAIVLGAPHYMSTFGIVGSVFVVCADRTVYANKQICVVKQFTGEQTGSSYGSSLVVDDFNNDGLDDLLVGAPLYFDGVTDGGAVYIYHGDPDSNVVLRVSGQRLKGSVPFGRFGTAMQCIGDINKDGFKDVAIGAPYENDLRGTVYVYHGGSQLTKAQTIQARDINPGLRSFGWYISISYDIDNNNYPDFLVGSYLSDHVTLLRARPIIKLDATLDVSPATIPLNSSEQDCPGALFRPCATIKICFTYTGDDLPDSIMVSVNISADTKMKELNKESRVNVRSQYDTNGTISNHELFVRRDFDSCLVLFAIVKDVDREFFSSLDTELEIKTTYGLASEAVPGDVRPILDNVSILRNKSVHFSNGCNGTCFPDLVVTSEFSTEKIILGTTSELVMTVHVINIGDLAHGTQINISMSSNTKFIGYFQPQNLPTEPISCQINAKNESQLSCEMRDTFFQHLQVIFKVRFLISRKLLMLGRDRIDFFRPDLDFMIIAESSTTDADFTNNQLHMMTHVKLQSEISLNGLSEPEQLSVSENADRYLNFHHTYEVTNKGPSPLYNGSLQLCIPTGTLSGKQFLTNDKVHVYSSGNKVRWVDVRANAPITEDKSITNSTINQHNTEQAEALFMDTESGVWEISCSAEKQRPHLLIQVIVDHLEVDESERFTLSVNISEEPFSFSQASQILFKSRITILDSEDDRREVVGLNATYEVSSEIYPRQVVVEVQKVNLWVVIGGSVGGFFLLIILGVILKKCGFFNRKKKKDVQEWKRQSGYYARRSTVRRSKKSRYDPLHGNPSEEQTEKWNKICAQ